MKSLGKSIGSSGSPLKSLLLLQTQQGQGPHRCSYSSSSARSLSSNFNDATKTKEDVTAVASLGISRLLSAILKELNKRVPNSLIKIRSEMTSPSNIFHGLYPHLA